MRDVARQSTANVIFSCEPQLSVTLSPRGTDARLKGMRGSFGIFSLSIRVAAVLCRAVLIFTIPDLHLDEDHDRE
jgi:hypothetical protein